MRAARLLSLLALATAACGRVGFDGASGGDAGVASDAPSTCASADDGIISIDSFFVRWALPESIAWRWTWSGLDADVDHFELAVGPSAADVACRTGAATVLGPAERPELAGPYLGATDTRVEQTISDAAPDQVVWAALTVVDTAGGRVRSAPVMAQAAPALTSRLDLFSEANPPGSYPIPAEFEESSDRPRTGAMTNRYQVSCPEASCFENLRRQGLGADLGAITDDDVARGVYELWIAQDGPTTAYWAELRLWPSNVVGNPLGVRELTLRGGGAYQRVQVPLAALEWGGQTLTAADLVGGLDEWGVGSAWGPAGTVVRVDDVALRW